MQTKECEHRNSEQNEELIGVLMAISIVSKRLARKLTALEHQCSDKPEGGKPDGQDE